MSTNLCLGLLTGGVVKKPDGKSETAKQDDCDTPFEGAVPIPDFAGPDGERVTAFVAPDLYVVRHTVHLILFQAFRAVYVVRNGIKLCDGGTQQVSSGCF